mmetsp:Transcript_19510/g.30114  ORF Transcript_19510/g.30114 Transcript_19510/m.30114 type:complete len:310 (+) Transcript_19510:60-989(+)
MRIYTWWPIVTLLLQIAPKAAAAWIGNSHTPNIHNHNKCSSQRTRGRRRDTSSSFLASTSSLSSRKKNEHPPYGYDSRHDEFLSDHHRRENDKLFSLTTHKDDDRCVRSHRRRLLRSVLTTTGLVITTTSSLTLQPCEAYTPDSDPLRESLYFISRVQEATVQQERFVRNTKLQEELQSKMKLTLRLVEKNYRLLDQINYASQFVTPASEIVTATEAGNMAVEALQGAIDFVKTDLQVGPLTPDQVTFLTESMQETRHQLFVFLQYMPAQKLEEARFRVEDENVKNRDEFDGESNAGVYNPVILPWKQP